MTILRARSIFSPLTQYSPTCPHVCIALHLPNGPQPVDTNSCDSGKDLPSIACALMRRFFGALLPLPLLRLFACCGLATRSAGGPPAGLVIGGAENGKLDPPQALASTIVVPAVAQLAGAAQMLVPAKQPDSRTATATASPFAMHSESSILMVDEKHSAFSCRAKFGLIEPTVSAPLRLIRVEGRGGFVRRK